MQIVLKICSHASNRLGSSGVQDLFALVARNRVAIDFAG